MNLSLGTIFSVLKLVDESTGPLNAIARSVQTRSGEIATQMEAVSVRIGAVNQRVKEFSGIPAMRAAEEMSAAVTKLGGASKLTADEQAKVNTVVTAALDKYRALGQQAPPHLEALAKATKQTTSVTEAFNGILGNFGLNLGTLTAAGGLAAGAAAFVKFGTDAFRAAGQLSDLSTKTGVSIQALQRLEIAGTQVGVGLDQAARAVTMLQKNLAGDDESAVAAVRMMGLNVGELLRLDPGRMFEEIARAIAQIHDPAERTRVAIEVLGKSGADTLPLLLADIDQLNEGVSRMSDKAVEGLDRAGDAIDRFKIGARNMAGETIMWFERLTESKRKFNAEFQRDAEILKQIKEQGAATVAAEMAATTQRAFEASVPSREKMLSDIGLLPPALKSAAAATVEFEKVNGRAYEKLLRDLEDVNTKTINWNMTLAEARRSMMNLQDLEKSAADSPFTVWNGELGDLEAGLKRVDQALADLAVVQASTVRWNYDPAIHSAESMEQSLKKVEAAVASLNAEIEAATTQWAVDFDTVLDSIERKFFDWGGKVAGTVTNLFAGLGKNTSTILGGLAGHFMSGLGSLITGGITSLIDMGINLAMQALSKFARWVAGLFKGEGAKTNDLRDIWMSQLGGLDAAHQLIASFGNDYRLLQAFERAYFASTRSELEHWIAIFEARLAALRAGAPIETGPPAGGGGSGGGGGGGPIEDRPGGGAGLFGSLGFGRGPQFGLAGGGMFSMGDLHVHINAPNFRSGADVDDLASRVGDAIIRKTQQLARVTGRA